MNNITLTATLVAILAATQGVTFLLRGWHNRLFRAFVFFCLTIFTANVGFVMSSLTESRVWYLVAYLGMLASAPATVAFFLRLLGRPQPRGASLRPLLVPLWLALSLLVVTSYEPLAEVGKSPIRATLLASLFAWWQGLFDPNARVIRLSEILLDTLRQLGERPTTHLVPAMVGLYVFGAYLLTWLNILERRKRTRSRLERTRLTLLAWLGGLTVLAVFLQTSTPFLEVWGSKYPLGGLAQIVLIAFLSQVILLYRLLDLHESVSKGLIFLAQVLIIGVVYGLLVALFGDRKDWVNLAITLFLASGVASLLYDPLRRFIERTIHRLFFHRRYELLVRLGQLERELPRILSETDLLQALMTALTDVPRITHAALFLWDERSRDYLCMRRSGAEGWPPRARIVALTSFVQELLHGRRPLEAQDLQREIEGSNSSREELSASLEALEFLQADVAVPFTGDGLLYGFIILKDDSMHEGFTHDELDMLQKLADRSSFIIRNSNAIFRMKERDRLATLGQMSAGLAHEIRNPLGAIRGAAQFLALDAEGQEKEFVEIIIAEVDRLDKVVTDFLDYSRPLKLRLENQNLAKVVGQVAALLSARGIPENVTLELDLDENLPPVPFDAEKMKQVLLNLLLNALQAMPKGGKLAIKTRRASRREFAGSRKGEATLERVEISVSDSGEGIPPDRLERLFVPFFTTKAGGTGLGLAISQRLVKAHEGELEVESSPVTGTRFIVRLPLYRSPTPSSEDTSQSGGAR